MQAEDRVIHFSAELIHAPAAFNKDAMRKLYMELAGTRAAYDSSDFGNPAQARLYSQRGPKTQSVALFLPDRVLIIEEWADMSLAEFLERVREVGARALEARGVPHYAAHTGTIRSTFALTHYQDARVFLMDHALGQAGKIAPHFQRPVAIGGMKYVLPESNDHPGMLNVTIESFRHSLAEVFVEVKGIFTRQQVTAAQMEVVLENLRSVRTFISRNIHPYLNQFDVPPQAPPA
jgi:hypothetical protein